MRDALGFGDGEEMAEKKVGIKSSQYQVLSAARVKSHQKQRLWGYLERHDMKNPVYYRLTNDGNFAGFKRLVTEWLPPGGTRWQLDPIEHDSADTQILSRPAMGTATLGREKISSGKQQRVTKPKSLKSPSGRGGCLIVADGDFPPMPKVKSPKKDND